MIIYILDLDFRKHSKHVIVICFIAIFKFEVHVCNSTPNLTTCMLLLRVKNIISHLIQYTMQCVTAAGHCHHVCATGSEDTKVNIIAFTCILL